MSDNSIKMINVHRYYPKLAPLMRLLDLDPDDSTDVFGLASALSSIRIVSDVMGEDAYEDIIEQFRDMGTCIFWRHDEYLA